MCDGEMFVTEHCRDYLSAPDFTDGSLAYLYYPRATRGKLSMDKFQLPFVLILSGSIRERGWKVRELRQNVCSICSPTLEILAHVAQILLAPRRNGNCRASKSYLVVAEDRA